MASSGRRLKIAVVVHGRWDAFDLTRALLARGAEARLYTNYPRWAVSRFGVPEHVVRSFVVHGALARVLARLPAGGADWRRDALLHPVFGRWAARQLGAEGWDVAYIFSGVAEESFRGLADRPTLRVLVRESSHIRTQDALLADEERRTGCPQQRPSRWMIAREEREYALADVIRSLSTFSYRSFLEHGLPPDRLKLVLSGAPLDRFQAAPEVIEARRQRILAGDPLRVLQVGTFTMRKGAWDTAAVVRALDPARFHVRFVGPVATDARTLADELADRGAVFVAKQPEASLPAAYAWGDVFLLPTIEDGFQAVLAQAAASALPILTTPNGAGHDLVREGRSGWVVPIRSPERIAARLHWADAHRPELAAMVDDTARRFRPRDFAAVASELEDVCRAARAARSRSPAGA